MLASLAEPRAFTQLRVQDQLGYVVWCTSAPYGECCTLTVGVQSSVNSAQHVQDRIEAFLRGTLFVCRTFPEGAAACTTNNLSLPRAGVLERTAQPGNPAALHGHVAEGRRGAAAHPRRRNGPMERRNCVPTVRI